MKKILYIWKSEYPWDVRVEKICKALIEVGYEVTILCRWGGEEKEREIIDGIKIIRVGKFNNRKISAPFVINPFWSKNIQIILTEFKPDLIIVREMLIAELSAKQAKKFNIPIIMDMAENYPACMREWKKYNNSSIKRFIIHKLQVPDIIEKRAIKLMDGIITVCDEQVIRLKKQFGFNQKQTVVVHNTPERNNFSSNDNIDLNNIIIGHHGFMTAEKSLRNFIIAFSKVKPPNIKFLIAGVGDCQIEYENIVKENNAQNFFIFSGSYNYTELATMLKQVDIGVLPYQISDFNNTTIHNKIFDFWTAGIPVVVSEARPLKRLIEETNTGKSIDCENIEETMKFIENIRKYNWKEMKEHTFKASQKYNWNQDKSNLIEFINNYL